MARPPGRAGRARLGARRLGPRLRDAGASRGSHGRLRRRLRLPAHRLDRSERRLSVLADRVDRAVRHREGVGRTGVDRSANSGAARGVLVRRVHRRRVGLRHAGRDLLGAPDGARLYAAVCCRPVADREHGAGRVRRDRHADPDAGGGHRSRRPHDWHDGGTSAAVRLADRSRVAGRDDERMARAARGVAGRPGVRRDVRDRPVRVEQFRRRRARGHRRRPGVDRRARDVPAHLAAAQVWEFPGRGSGRTPHRERSTGQRWSARGCRGCFSALR